MAATPDSSHVETIEFGVMSSLAITRCRGGRGEAQEHLRHRRGLGHEVTLVSRWSCDGIDESDSWEVEYEVYSAACVGGCGQVFDLPQPVAGTFICRRCGGAKCTPHD